MFNKLISTFKALQPDTQSAAESEASKSISTPEKTAALMGRLEGAIAAAQPGMPRFKLLRNQLEQVKLASRHHDIGVDRQRVAHALERDKASGEKALEEAQKRLARADQVLATQQERHRAVIARLEPLESQAALTIQSAADAINAAQAAFDQAVIKGDEPGEIAAANKLYRLQNEGKGATGPLQLRLAAIRREESDVKAALADASQARQDASDVILLAKADLALVEYDRQAQALVDAYVAQAIAVRACGGKHRSAVSVFDVQVSSAEHILFGTTMTDYNRRRLPGYVVDGIVTSLSAKPDLALLATRAEDIAEPVAEPVHDVAPFTGGVITG